MRSTPTRLAAWVLAVLLGTACGFRGGDAEFEAPAVLDVNSAPVRRLETLPGVTPSMAGRIAAGRPYASVDELVSRGILTERELDRLRSRIVAQPAR